MSADRQRETAGEAARPLVTVILPYTARDALFARAMESVERALHRAPEITAQILPVDDTARTGVSAARNRGLSQATGDWIVFVDADDLLSPDFFSEIVWPLHERQDIDLIVGGYETIGLEEEMPEPTEGDPKKEETPFRFCSGYSYIEKRILNRDAHVWGKAFRRAALLAGEGEPDSVRSRDDDRLSASALSLSHTEEAASYGIGSERIFVNDKLAFIKENEALTFDINYQIGEDMLFLADMALRLAKRRAVAVTERCGYYYRENPAGAMESKFSPRFLDELFCWEALSERFQELPHGRALTPYAHSALGGIRIRSALLVAVRIGRLPEGEREEPENREAMDTTRAYLKEALRIPGAFGGLSLRDKARALLLLAGPTIFYRSLKLAKK